MLSSESAATAVKKLVALADGYRESTESWAEPLGDYLRRGMGAAA